MIHRVSGLLTTFLVTAVAFTARAQDMPFHRHDWSWGWGMMFVGPLMMILFVAAIIVLVVLAVRWLVGDRHGPVHAPGRTPLDILKERFARGEIDKQEFEERRRILDQ